MDRSYYLQYHEFEKNHWWFRARAEILKSYIISQCEPAQDTSILNVGAATGGSIAWLSELGKVTSLEYDKESAIFIREHLKESVVDGSILALPFPDNSFDLVCAFDVIEHVENDKLAVGELIRVCKATGSVLITVPAHMHLWSPHDEVNQHYRRYSMESLKELLDKAPGGKIVFMTYFNHYFYTPIRWIRRMNNFLSGLKKNQEPKSDFEEFHAGWLNELCFFIMRGEKIRISAKRPFGSGVSILSHWRKNQK